MERIIDMPAHKVIINETDAGIHVYVHRLNSENQEIKPLAYILGYNSLHFETKKFLEKKKLEAKK